MDIQFINRNGQWYRVEPFNSMGFCRDCDEYDIELKEWRYEPEVLLCEGCYESRMEDEQ